jgi:hypothetical protein
MYIDLNWEVKTNAEFAHKLRVLNKDIARLEKENQGDPHVNDKIAERIIDIYRLCKYNAGLLVPYFFPNYPYDKPLSCSARPYSFSMFHMQLGGFLAIRAGRQIGKSTSLAARQLMYAHIMKKRRSMYIVPHQSFLDTYANRVREMERSFRFYQQHKDYRQNLKYKEYPNESIIMMVKCLTDTQEARSKTTDEALFDESVHPNTKVAVYEGNAIKLKKISDILVGEKVLTYNAEGSIKAAYVRYNKNKGIKHTWKLKFSNGAELICTGNTRFWTSRGWMFLSEFLSWEEAARGDNLVKAKTLLTIREAATPGDSSWRRQHAMGIEITRTNSIHSRKGTGNLLSVQSTSAEKLCKNATANCGEQRLGQGELRILDCAAPSVQFYVCPGLPPGFYQYSETGQDGYAGPYQKSKEIRTAENSPHGDLYPVTLDSIEYAGKEEVWDIDVEEHHTFFANGIAIHNCQLLDPDFLPDIEQCQKASRMASTIYAGTSTTTDSLLETKFLESSQAAWVLRAPGYHSNSVGAGWLNCSDKEDILKAIQPQGITNPATGKIIDATDGHFVHQIQSNFEQGYLGFHIPQIIIPDYANAPHKWMEIWNAFQSYDIKKFLQEILGIPTEEGMREITLQDLKNICIIPDSPETLKQQVSKYKYTVSGCDWGGSDYNPATRTKVSFTVHVILGICWDGSIEIIHIRQYSGMDYRSISNQICDDHKAYNCIGIASDFGVGAAYNMLLRENPIIRPERHFIFGYVGPQSALIKAPSSGPGWFNQYSLNRTESITSLYQAIKSRRFRCYSWDLAQERLSELLNLYRVPTETMGGNSSFRYQRHGSKADDTLHAINFAFCLARIVLNEPILEDPALSHLFRETFNSAQPAQFFNPHGGFDLGGAISG